MLETLKIPGRRDASAAAGVPGVCSGVAARKDAEHDAKQRQTEAMVAHDRERLAWIIEGTHVGTWEWNVQTGETVFDERWAEMLGYSLEELAPVSIETWKRLSHPEDYGRSVAALASHFRGECDRYECEMRMRHRDGSWVWVLDRGRVATRSADGRPLMMLGTHQDVTPRKQAEADLIRLAGLQRTLMHLATDFVNVPLERQDTAIAQSLETMGRLIRADRVYLFAYDFRKGTMSNTHEWCNVGIAAEIDKLQEVPNALFPEWVAAHRRGELVHVRDVLDLEPAGNLRQVLEPQGIRSLITLPLMQGSACLGYVGFDAVREVREWGDDEISLLRVLAELYAHFLARSAADREMRTLQEQLTEARDQAREAARAKTLFLANMSHEIRTPLNAILGYTQIIGRECRTCEVAQRMKGLTKSGEHLLELINDLLLLARSDGQAITLAPVDFDFHQLLEGIRLTFAHKLAAQGMGLVLERAADVPRVLHADPGKIRQVLVNLVGNALKFGGDGCVTLTTAMRRDGSDALWIDVDVTDKGCGIAEADHERIFDLFVCLDDGRKETGGTGLGLPLSRRYARALGGDLLVKASRVGGGSTFRFTFKAQAIAGDFALIDGASIRLADGQSACGVLVVDDDPATLDMMATLLRSVGFAVETESDAAHALSRLSDAGQPPISVVLMDKRMPDVDGYEAIRRLRALPGGHGMKTIIVTAAGLGNQMGDALAAGADGYVAKPVRLTALLGEMARVAGIRFTCQTETSAAPREQGSLAALPETRRRALTQAIRRGDIRLLRTLAADIERSDRASAATMRACLEVYDYDGLQKLLDVAQEGTA